MNPRTILPILMLIQSPLLVGNAFGNNECAYFTKPDREIYLEDLVHREKLEAPFKSKEIIRVCNLIQGEAYVIQIVQKYPCQSKVGFIYEGQNQTKLSFVAEQPCQELELEFDHSDKLCGENLFLSISCKSLIKEDKFLSKSLAPIQVTASEDCNYLIEDVFIGGGCFDINNITCIGGSGGKGTFSQGMTSIGLEEGVIISTGDPLNAMGPNNSSGASQSLGGGGDADIDILLGGSISSFDARGIEFDFTPTLNTINFEYVFASEEYCEYVNAGFNDAFGFFISGPGISGGFTASADNIAIIPGTSDFVTIDLVNTTNNSAYFVSNSPSCSGYTNQDDIEFDGYTTVFTATANVIPCSTYHIRLVIADAGDSAFDSAVFLKANSFDAGGSGGGEAVSTLTGDNVYYEQCNGTGSITFEVTGADPTVPFEINYTIDPSSTATEGVDYLPLPNPIIIPAGQTSVSIPVTLIDDGVGEGQENIILVIDAPCSCENSEVEIIIDELQPLEANLSDFSQCAGQNVSLSPTVSGGWEGSPYTYEWSTGSTDPSITESPSETTTYSVTVSDECGSTIVSTSMVTVEETSSATIAGDYIICAGSSSSTATILVDFTGNGPWTFVYAINGANQAAITTNENPYNLVVSNAGTISLVSVETGMLPNGGTCPGTVSGNASVTEVTIDPNLTPTHISCLGANDGAISVAVDGGTPNYNYNWSNGGSNSSTLDGLPPGYYELTVTDADGCTGTSSIEITSPSELSVSTSSSEANCNNNGGTLFVSANGGTPDYTYNWSNGSNASSQNNVAPGAYNVTISDANGCTDVASVTVEDNTIPPNAVAGGTGIIDCINQSIQINGNGSTTGSGINYQWSGPGIVSGGNTLNPMINSGGVYTLVVTDTDSGCTAEASLSVSEDLTPPTAIATGSDLDCNNSTVQLDGTGSSTGSGILYQWTGPGIVSGANTLHPTVNQPGSYTLVVTDNNNGCTAELVIDINENTQTPNAVAQGSQLDCNNSTIQIDGTGSSTGTNITYLWIGPGIVSGANTLNPTVDASGTYTLVVTDTDNGCTAETFVAISENIQSPNASAQGPQLDCNNPTVVIDGTGSSTGANFTYQWTGPGIVSGGNTINPTINASGTYTIIVTDTGNGCTAETSVAISENIQSPNASAQGSQLNCNNSTIILDGTGSSAGTNITYQWTGPGIVSGGNTLNPVVNASGTYTLVVTDADNGCTAEALTNITEDNTPPFATAFGNDLDCNNSSIQIDGSGSSTGSEFTYQWTGVGIVSGSNTLNPTVNQTGIFTLVITNNNNGCTAETSVNINENLQMPNAAAQGSQLNCSNSTVIIDGTGSSTGTNITYQWTGPGVVFGENTLNPTVDAAGVYTLLVTDTNNGCTAEAGVTITEDNTPPVANASGNSLDCNNTSILISGAGSSTGTNISYQWTGPSIVAGDNTLTPTIDAGGIYTILVTNADNGCTAEAVTNITEDNTPPVANAIGNDLDCNNSSIQIDGSGSSTGTEFTYQWTGPGIVSGSNTLNPTVDQAGTFTLTITNNNNGCTAETFVTINEDIQSPIAVASGAQLDCNNSTVIIDGTGSSTGTNITYQWTGPGIVSGGNTVNPTVNAGGDYTILVTDTNNGCTSEAIVNIIQDLNPPIANINPVPPYGCIIENQIITATGSTGGNFSYNWTNAGGSIISGGNTLTPTINGIGTYTLVVTDGNNGCTVESSVVVDQEIILPTIDILPPLAINCHTTIVTLDGSNSESGANITYNWTTTNGNIISGTNSNTAEVDSEGTYTLIVTDNNSGCTDEMTVHVANNTNMPIAMAGPDQTITCAQQTAILDSSGSTDGPDIIYEWYDENGNLIDVNASTMVSAIGTYQLIIIDLSTGCTGSDFVTVESNENIPTANIIPPAEINCSNSNITISSTVSSPDLQLTWTTTNGTIVSGGNTTSPTVSSGGTYQLTLLDPVSGCSADYTTTVVEDVVIPQVNINPVSQLDCNSEQIVIDASNSSVGLIYTWTTNDGNIVNGSSTLTPIVDAAGTYNLTISNPENGCSNNDVVVVTADFTDPTINIQNPDWLTCYVNQVVLDASNSSIGNNFSYQWTGGGIISGANTLTPIVNEGGTYSLIITNNNNGCTAANTINVNENTQMPVAVAQGSQLDCNNAVVSIDGTGSSVGTNFSYQWTGSGIISGGNTLNPIVNQPGPYTLLVTNLQNGCTDETTVFINQDAIPPFSNITPPSPYGCIIDDLFISATGSTGSNFSYNWTSIGGSIVSGGSSLTPIVNGVGTYTLLITNNNNGCTSEASITVGQQVDLPEVNVVTPMDLDCYTSAVILDGSASQFGSGITYTWITADGNILSGEGSNIAVVDSEGTYTLIVSNTNNGCSNEMTIEVADNTNFLEAEAGPNQSITCEQQIALLDGLGSATGPTINYQWFDENGNLINTNLVTSVNTPGTYQLVVTDISTGCTDSDFVTVESNENIPTAIILPPDEINCVNPFVTISSTASSADLVIDWSTTDGNIVSGANTSTPTVDAGGLYQLTLSDPLSGCSSDYFINVNENTLLPEVDILLPSPLNCATPEVTIDASSSSSGINLNYSWSTNNGNIVSGDNTLTPLINAGGTYNLVISNLNNGCTASSQVVVEENFDSPEINIQDPEMITCDVNQLILNAANSSNGNNYSIEWTTSNGNIISEANTLNPVVGSAGVYELIITDLTSQCFISETVEVFQDNDVPTADAGQPALLDCITDNLTLNGTATGGNNLSIQWTTNNGNILNGANTLQPEIDTSGDYLLTVINLDNNCEATSTVTIEEDVTVPNAEIVPSTEITCTNPTLILDASNSSNDPELNYSWTTDTGTILNGASTLFPEVGSAGTYILNVFDPSNNCESSAQVIVIENNEVPTVDTGAPQTIGCGDDFIELSATANSNSNPFLTIEWTTQNGSISGDPNALNTTVDAAGIYTINVIDPTNGCTASAQVEITQNVEIPEISIGNDGEITCDETSINLSATVNGNLSNYIYEWQTINGNIASGANTLTPNVDAAGTYTLTVLDTINNCSSVDSLFVTEDANIPEAIVEADGSLNCVNNSVILEASNSTTGPGITFEWTTNNGNFLDGQNTLSPTIDMPGLYTLTIIDSNNDCTNSTGISIEMDTLAPTPQIGNPGILTCATLEVELDASNSFVDGDFSIIWTTDNGQFVSGTDSLNPIVNQPGIYELQIVNNENGCASSTSIEVNEETQSPSLIIQEPDDLNCFNNTVALNATESDNATNFTFEWSTDVGNILIGEGGLSPVVDASGVYTLVITNILNGCQSEESVSVIQNDDVPEAQIEASDDLTCLNESLVLNGENSSNGNIFEYQWTSSEASQILDENTLNPTIQTAGWYHLLVTNISNGCIGEDSIFIDQNIEPPTADAGSTDELTCSVIQLNLDGTLSTQTVEMEYFWTTSNGNIVEGENTITPLINAPGLYTIQVLDTENGCTATSDVLITQDVEIPSADAGVANDLTCLVNEIFLNGENSETGSEITYLWSTTDGNIIEGDSTLTPTINEAGTYTLIVSNTGNNCSSTSSVIIDENMEVPIADAGDTFELSCMTESLTLNGELSSTGDDFTYNWTTQNGNILSGEESIYPTIDAPGIYSIIVTNQINGCTAANSVEITQSLDVPVAFINTPAELNCLTNEVTLDASQSSQGDEFEYLWTTQNGTILSGANSLNPIVSSTGIYQILVTNNDNGCTNSFPIEVIENLLEPTAEAGQTEELTCTISSLELDGVGSSMGNNFTYLWTTQNGNIASGNNSLTPTITAPGAYQIIVTDELNGCTSTDIVEITADEAVPFAVIAQPDQLTCLIETMLLDATNSSQGNAFDYFWSTSNGNILNGETSLEPTVNQAGNYQLMVTNNENGCTSAAEITVLENTTLPSVDAGDSFAFNCFDDIQFILGSGNANGDSISYNWSTSNGAIANGQNTATLGIQSGGLYQLTIINTETGCQNSDEVVIMEDAPIANQEATQPLCHDDLGAINIFDVQGGTAPYLYSIDGGESYHNNAFFNNLGGGIYEVVVQDANGCEASQEIEIIQPEEVNVMFLQDEMTIEQGGSVQLNLETNIPENEIEQIIWTPSDGLSCIDCLNPIANPLSTTLYTVEIQSTNGCFDQAPYLLSVDKKPEIHLPNIFSPNEDGYNDVFMIFTNAKNIQKVKSFLIFNRWGESVFQYYNIPPNDPTYGWDGTFRGKVLDSGVFTWFAEVEFTDGRVEVFGGDVTLMK